MLYSVTMRPCAHVMQFNCGYKHLQSLSQYEDLYREEWRNYFNNTNYSSHPNDTAKTAFGYDATWLAAQALHGAEEELRTMDPPRSLLDFFENEENQTETKKYIQDRIYLHARTTAFNGSSVSMDMYTKYWLCNIRYIIITI